MKRKWKDSETARKAKPEATNADHESESSEEDEGAAKWAQYFDDEDSDEGDGERMTREE